MLEDPEQLSEGRRVATAAVVLVEPDEAGGIAVSKIEELVSERPISEEIELFTGSDSWARAGDAGSDMVALAEQGVLPLPGCLEVAAATLEHHESSAAVAVKLLDSDGLLEGAGVSVFADGSAEGVGAGSEEVSAPWHEYLRPVCGGDGLLVARASALQGIGGEGESLMDLAGRLWSSGHGVLYQPEAWAVRAHPDEAEEPRALGEAWSQVLSSRPERPEPLDLPTWRWLLAHDDIEEGWR